MRALLTVFTRLLFTLMATSCLCLGLTSGEVRAESPQGQCAQDSDCPTHQACGLFDRCVTFETVDCQRSLECKTLGLCSYVRGACRAGDNLDCSHAEVCLQRGACVAKGGQCAALNQVDSKAPRAGWFEDAHPGESPAELGWFARADGADYGPMAWRRLVEMVQIGQLSQHGSVWHEAMDPWRVIGDYDALSDALSSRTNGASRDLPRAFEDEDAAKQALSTPVGAEFHWYDSWIGWTASGVGLMAVTLSALFAANYTSDMSALRQEFSDPRYSIESSQDDYAIGLGLAGALAMAGGVVAFVYHRPSSPPDPWVGMSRFELRSLSPVVLPGGAGLALGANF